MDSSNTKNNEPVHIYFDPRQFCIVTLFKRSFYDLNHELNRLGRKIFYSTREKISSKKEVDEEEFFQTYFSVCESLLEEILSSHSKYELIYWNRRLAPRNIFDANQFITVLYYREVLTNAIYKYGDSNINTSVTTTDQNEFISTTKVCPDYINDVHKTNTVPDLAEKVITDVIDAEVISYLLTRAHQRYRIFQKGGKFHLTKGGPQFYNVVSSQDLGHLIDLYDERLYKNDIFSNVGANYQEIFANKKIKSTLTFVLNVDQEIKDYPLFNFDTEGYSDFPDKSKPVLKFPSNYLLLPIDLEEVYDFLSIYDDELDTSLGFRTIHLCVFLNYLGLRLINNISRGWDSQYSIIQRGYFVEEGLDFLKDDFYSFLENISQTIWDDHLSKDDFPFKNILDFFQYKENEYSEINLWTRGPRKLIYPMGNNIYLYDYTAIPSILQYTTKDFASKDGEVGNRKSSYFEEQIKIEASNIFGEKSIILHQDRIVDSETGKSKEVDLAFQLENILILLEAKSINVSFGFDMGTKGSIDFRINKFKKAIKQVNEKARFINNYNSSLNIQFPDDINFICPVVISPHAEFIWEKSEDLFLDSQFKIPRIITTEDFEGIKNLDLPELINKNYIYEISN